MRLLKLFLLLILFYGCTKDKYKAPDAFFVKPQTIAVATTTLQGSTSHNITDIWYYINGQFKGAYPVGNIMPFPVSGNNTLSFFAGIKNNGISATRQPYEFYQPIIIDTTVEAGATVNRNFTFKYKDACVFHWIESFEGYGTTTGITIQNSINTDTTYQILNKSTDPTADVFEGSKCFYIALDNNHPIGQYQSTALFTLPKAGAPVYLEMNYKCNQPFDVGVYNGSNFTYVSSVNSSDGEWKKIYIQLSAGVTINLATTAGWYMKAVKQTDTPQIYIDNIKIISY